MLGERMNCAEFARMVHDLARSRGLTEAETAIARSHAEICPSCGFQLAEAEKLAAVFKRVSADSRSLSAPETVESTLMALFRASNGEARRYGKRRWQIAFGWVSAAALASLLAFFLVGRESGPSLRPATSSGADRVATAIARAKALNTSVVAISPSTSTESASGFVPVPFAGGFARGDSGVVVRVQLPSTALAELGYPVDETQGEAMVQADLIVGEDGWPRAVRIVH